MISFFDETLPEKQKKKISQSWEWIYVWKDVEDNQLLLFSRLKYKINTINRNSYYLQYIYIFFLSMQRPYKDTFFPLLLRVF